MRTHSWHILLVIAAFSVPLCAHSTDSNLLTVSSLFSQMDSDRDGAIRPNEINKQSLLSNEFGQVDKNRNGSLDPEEFEIFIIQADI